VKNILLFLKTFIYFYLLKVNKNEAYSIAIAMNKISKQYFILNKKKMDGPTRKMGIFKIL